MHVNTVNYLLNAGFFCELLYNCESFPANNKKIMQPQNFSTANYLHYTVFAHDRSHEETSDKRRNKNCYFIASLSERFCRVTLLDDIHIICNVVVPTVVCVIHYKTHAVIYSFT